MSPSDWLPGLGHWRLGQPLKGATVLGLFLLFVGIAGWHARTMWESLSHTLEKLSGANVPYTPRDLDFLVSTLFVLGMLVAILLYSGISCQRKQQADLLARLPDTQWTIVKRQFQRNRLAVAGAVIILALYLVAFLCPFLAPYDPAEQVTGCRNAFSLPRLITCWERIGSRETCSAVSSMAPGSLCWSAFWPWAWR